MNVVFKTDILKNGLTVKSLKNRNLHSVNIGIYAHKIPEPVCGIAHLTEHMFFRRLSDVGQDRLYYETDRLGATLRAVTYADFICFDITVSPSRFKAAFNLIAKFFDDFQWTPREVVAEKKVVRRQIEDRYDSVYSKADMIYYVGTPKGAPIMGNISNINKISTRLLNKYREDVFAPNNCCVVLTGNFSDDDYRYCEKTLNKISQDREIECIGQFDYSIKEFSDRDYKSDKIYKSDYEFSDVIISFDVDTKRVNRYASEILHSIIGYGVTSKLSRKLREENGFVSEIDGNIEFSGGKGRMTFEYEVKNTDLEQSLNAAFEVISQVKAAVTDEDLKANIVFYTDNQYRILDDVRELNFLIGHRNFIQNEGICSIEDLSRRYSECTIDNINRAANEILRPQNLIITASNNSGIYKKSKLADVFEACRKEL